MSENAPGKGEVELPPRSTFESLTIRALEELGGEAHRHPIRDCAIWPVWPGLPLY